MKTTCPGSGKPTVANKVAARHALVSYSECSHCARKFNKNPVGTAAPRHIVGSVVHANSLKAEMAA